MYSLPSTNSRNDFSWGFSFFFVLGIKLEQRETIRVVVDENRGAILIPLFAKHRIRVA